MQATPGTAVTVARIAAISSEHVHLTDAWAHVVSSFAWPLAVVILAVVFRAPLRALLDKLTQFEGLGLKASFGKDVEKLAEAAEVAQTSDAPMENNPATGQNGPLTEAELSYPPSSVLPATLVLDAWFRLERAMSGVAAQNNGILPGNGPVEWKLDRAGLISPATYQAIREARQLRNRAVHGSRISPAEATLYWNTTNSLAHTVERQASYAMTGAAPETPQN